MIVEFALSQSGGREGEREFLECKNVECYAVEGVHEIQIIN